MDGISVTTLAASNPLDHVVNHPFWWIEIGGQNWWIWSSHIGNLFLVGAIMLWLFPKLASMVATGPESLGSKRHLPRGTWAHVLEVMCIYLRDSVVRPLLGNQTEKYIHFLWTLFFFILLNNLLGLIPVLDIMLFSIKALAHFGVAPVEWVAQHRSPFGATATGNLWVNACLAIITLLMYLVHGFRNLGPSGFAQHMTGGAPAMVWPIIIPIELASTFIIKPAALIIRLFANMTAGHVLLAVMVMFIGLSTTALPMIVSGPISIASMGAMFAFYFLELLVAVLQAFIFMFLTTIFISQMSHHGHDEEHGHAAHAH